MEIEARACVGCGCCCLKAPCVFALEKHGDFANKVGCPELQWNGFRHICLLAIADKNIAKSLDVGEGCCMPLNTWRLEIKNRIGDS